MLWKRTTIHMKSPIHPPTKPPIWKGSSWAGKIKIPDTPVFIRRIGYTTGETITLNFNVDKTTGLSWSVLIRIL